MSRSQDWFLFSLKLGSVEFSKNVKILVFIFISRKKMVSRRKILSRSKDNLNDQEEEDVWYQKDKLFRVMNRYILLQLTIGLR